MCCDGAQTEKQCVIPQNPVDRLNLQLCCSSQRHTPDIGNIGAPLQILGDCVKVDKESREQQHRDSCNRPYKCGYLGGAEDIHRVTYYISQENVY